MSSNFLFGSKGRIQPVPTLTPGQGQLLQRGTQSLGGPLEDMLRQLQQLMSGDESAMQAYEAPLMRKFNEQIVPGIAERFSGLGAGSQSSSAFPQALGQAGASLTETLGAQRAGLKDQAMGRLMQYLQSMMGTRAFENVTIPGSKGFLQGGMESGGLMDLMKLIFPLFAK